MYPYFCYRSLSGSRNYKGTNINLSRKHISFLPLYLLSFIDSTPIFVIEKL